MRVLVRDETLKSMRELALQVKCPEMVALIDGVLIGATNAISELEILRRRGALYAHLDRCSICGAYEGSEHVGRMHGDL